MPVEKDRQDRPRKRLASRVFSVVSILVALLLIHLWQTRDLVDGRAPALSGQILGGERFDLHHQGERPLLVHFWASWCPVCRLESGGIASLSKDYPVVSVAMQSGSESEVTEFLGQNLLQIPVINDPDGKLAAAWRVSGVPTSYIIGRDGRVKFSSVGYTLPLTLRARLWLAEFW
ncbi:MAG: protein disulfide oxidoreductase [Candidatus Thiodiazotropha sp.]